MNQCLKTGTLLRDTYRIEHVLGQGGFGITYLALDVTLNKLVAVKEFFPKNFCNRDGSTSQVTVATQSSAELVARFKDKFLKEARNIAGFDHPNIIKIYAAFEANNTAYYVMEYIDGVSLSELVRRDGPLAEARAVGYIEQVGSALEYIHAHRINHLDVKPANIMVRRRDNCPILIDFGLSKQYDVDGQQTSTTPVGISHGFAPFEQYKNGGVSTFSPSTDLYSLAATLYFLLSGVVPTQAPDLVDSELTFPASIPSRLIPAIAKAMSLARANRFGSVAEFLRAMGEKPEEDTVMPMAAKPEIVMRPTPPAPPAGVAEAGVKPQSEDEEQGKKDEGISSKAILGIIVVAFVMIGFAYLLSKDSNSKSNEGAYVTTSKPAQPSPVRVSTYNANGELFEMVEVDGGSFMMGSDDAEAQDAEKPVHAAWVNDFAIGKTEVTQALWKAVMGKNPSKFKGDYLPVENVSWNECQEFIAKLNSLTGKRFRLPTEAEWEFAARGGNRSNGFKYSGSNNIDQVAWHKGNSGGRSHQVATKEPNELGIYDMTGNVIEWMADKWCVNYNSSRGGNSRVGRGGSWFYDAGSCRVAYRDLGSPSGRHSSLGLRLAL